MTSNMPSAICLNRVGDSDRIEGFDDNNCHVGTGYVKANRAFMDIDNERQRQIRKGYDAAHDDADNAGNHARAAAYYATCGYWQRVWEWGEDPGRTVDQDELDDIAFQAGADSLGYPWPFRTLRIEPTARDNLVKAAALIVAEIERIDRKVASE